MIDPLTYSIAFGWDPAVEVERLVGLCARPPARVLELGCGPGRLLAAFAARGVEVVGIELSAEMVAHARGHLPGAAVVHRGDMSRGEVPGSFDLVFASANTFRHLTDDRDLRRTLARVADWIAPGGVFVVDLELGREHFADMCGRPQIWTLSRGGTEVRATWQLLSMDGAVGTTELLLETRREGRWDPVCSRFPLRCDDASEFLSHAQAGGLALKTGGILREPDLLLRPAEGLQGRCVLCFSVST